MADDPIVQYLVVKSSLNMSPGKVCAQCGHAVEHIMLEWFKLEAISVKKGLSFHLPDDILEHIQLTSEWIARGSLKVVVRANDEEFERLKTEYDHDCYVVRDAGKTEVAPGTETVMITWPQHKSQFGGMIQHLPLY